jgi:serine/threonine protein phosphatase PrpC
MTIGTSTQLGLRFHGATRTAHGRIQSRDRWGGADDVLVIATGAGPSRGCGLAAEIATDLMLSATLRLREAAPVVIDQADAPGAARLQASVREAAARTDHAIGLASMIDDHYRGLAASVAVAVLDGDRLVHGHLGNARIWWVHEGRLEPLTHDHGSHEALERCLGQGQPALETGETRVALGDLVILATAGLHRTVTREQVLRACLDGKSDPRSVTSWLLEWVPPRWTEDATCVVGRVEPLGPIGQRLRSETGSFAAARPVPKA